LKKHDHLNDENKKISDWFDLLQCVGKNFECFTVATSDWSILTVKEKLWRENN
jgi:hypothetical protein